MVSVSPTFAVRAGLRCLINNFGEKKFDHIENAANPEIAEVAVPIADHDDVERWHDSVLAPKMKIMAILLSGAKSTVLLPADDRAYQTEFCDIAMRGIRRGDDVLLQVGFVR